MEDKDKTVEKTTAQNSTEETKTEETKSELGIDYDKELQEQVERFEEADHNREGFAKRKAKEQSEEKEETDIDQQVAKAIEKSLPKIVNTLQSNIAQDTVETLLDSMSGGNPAKRKLIKFHFENSVGAYGTIRERLENAALIADKKVIQQKQTELTTALKNRAGLGASGLGGSSEDKQPVGDNILSADQIKDLKARGWDDKKIERFKQNLQR